MSNEPPLALLQPRGPGRERPRASPVRLRPFPEVLALWDSRSSVLTRRQLISGLVGA